MRAHPTRGTGCAPGENAADDFLNQIYAILHAETEHFSNGTKNTSVQIANMPRPKRRCRMWKEGISLKKTQHTHTKDTAHTLAKYKIVSVPSSAQFKYKKFQRKYFTLKKFF